MIKKTTGEIEKLPLYSINYSKNFPSKSYLYTKTPILDSFYQKNNIGIYMKKIRLVYTFLECNFYHVNIVSTIILY